MLWHFLSHITKACATQDSFCQTKVIVNKSTAFFLCQHINVFHILTKCQNAIKFHYHQRSISSQFIFVHNQHHTEIHLLLTSIYWFNPVCGVLTKNVRHVTHQLVVAILTCRVYNSFKVGRTALQLMQVWQVGKQHPFVCHGTNTI